MNANCIRVILICVLFAALAGIVAMSLDGVRSIEDAEFVSCISVLGGLLALPLALTLRKGTVRLDHPSAIMSCVLTLYWLPGLYVARNDQNTLCTNARDFVAQSALAGAIAAATFYLGAGLPSKDEVQQEPALSKPGFIFWLGAFVVLWLMRFQQVRLGSYFTHASVERDLTEMQSTYGAHIASTLYIVPPFLAVSLWRSHRVAASAIFLSDFLFTLFTGARLIVIHITLLLAISASLHNRRISLRAMVTPFFLFMLVINPLVYRMRANVAMQGDRIGLGPFDVADVTFGSASGEPQGNEIGDTFKRASAGGYLADIICLSDHRMFKPLEGSTFLDSIAIMIPRFMWREKSLPESSDMVTTINTKLALPEEDAVGNPVMEGYINFSFAGVAAVFLLLGLTSRLLWAYRVRHRLNTATLGLYVLSIVPFFFFETHSTFGNFTSLRIPFALMIVERVLRGPLQLLGQAKTRPPPCHGARRDIELVREDDSCVLTQRRTARPRLSS